MIQLVNHHKRFHDFITGNIKTRKRLKWQIMALEITLGALRVAAIVLTSHFLWMVYRAVVSGSCSDVP